MRAFITGISGQDGSYLCELLLSKGYEVHGLLRVGNITSDRELKNLGGSIAQLGSRLYLHHADLEDTTTLRRVVQKIEPSEIYHLAGQTSVAASFNSPEYTCRLTGMASLSLLEIIRDLSPRPKFVFASSSEIFGRPSCGPQTEVSPMAPVTPYGAAKAFATQIVRIYRDSYDLFAANAICYNHESERRQESFVTRKITRAAARIKLGLDTTVSLGNISALRDWGYAPDFVEAMWRIMQQSQADDFVLATGALFSIEDCLVAAFGAVGLDWKEFVKTDVSLMRSAEDGKLFGLPTKAENSLGWQRSIGFHEMIKRMVKYDVELARRETASTGG